MQKTLKGTLKSKLIKKDSVEEAKKKHQEKSKATKGKPPQALILTTSTPAQAFSSFASPTASTWLAQGRDQGQRLHRITGMAPQPCQPRLDTEITGAFTSMLRRQLREAFVLGQVLPPHVSCGRSTAGSSSPDQEFLGTIIDSNMGTSSNLLQRAGHNVCRA